MEYSLDLNENQYEVRTLTMGETTIRFRAFEDLVYVRHPVDLEHQKLNLYIPEDYYEGKTIHGYTGKTVPIFFPNASGAYASGPADRPGPNFRLWGRGKPNGIFYALAAGFVVAAPGSRGRTVQDENGDFLGCAPAHIVDLKAAVRYLRHNKDRILGDTEHIISNGTSAGGALSALLGTSGNSVEYEPYLEALGAAQERDDIFAASCYTPIMDLEHADMAYEWMFHGVNHYELHIVKNICGELHESFVEGDMTPEQIEQSDFLVARFADYVNSLGLEDGTGTPLELSSDGSGSFRDYVTSFVVQSAQRAMDQGADLSGMPWITEAKMSSKEAVRRGSMPYSSLISLAMEPDMTIATVLLAVATSTAATRPAMPSWAPFLEPTRRWMKSMSHWTVSYTHLTLPTTSRV